MARRRNRSYTKVRNFLILSMVVVVLVGVIYNWSKIESMFSGTIADDENVVIEEQVIELPKNEQVVVMTYKQPEEIQLSDSPEAAQEAYSNAGYEVKMHATYVPNPMDGIVSITKGSPVVIHYEALRSREVLMHLQEQLKIAGYYTIRDGGYGPSLVEQLVLFKTNAMNDNSSSITTSVFDALAESNSVKIVSDPSNLLVVVNHENNLLSSYQPSDLVDFSVSDQPNVMLSARVTDQLSSMMDKARQEGINLSIIQGYRDYAGQESIFNKILRRSNYTLACSQGELPGQSEYQTGLAIDFSDENNKYNYDVNFTTSNEYQWLIDNCSDYGFILRYPQGKESITGHDYQPWHFRYIGDSALAEKMMREGLTLEELEE